MFINEYLAQYQYIVSDLKSFTPSVYIAMLLRYDFL